MVIYFIFQNDAAGIQALITALPGANPARIVLEATGGLERARVAELLVAELPVAVVNPRQVRRFAQALGYLAKTDRLDARMLAHFAAAVQPPVRVLPDAPAQALADQLARRRQRVERLTMEKNRLQQAQKAGGRLGIERHIDGIEQQLKMMERGLHQAVARWAGKSRFVARSQGPGRDFRPDAVGEFAGTGDPESPANRRSGGRRVVESGEWNVAGIPPGLGRTGRGPSDPVYGHPVRRAS